MLRVQKSRAGPFRDSGDRRYKSRVGGRGHKIGFVAVTKYQLVGVRRYTGDMKRLRRGAQGSDHIAHERAAGLGEKNPLHGAMITRCGNPIYTFCAPVTMRSKRAKSLPMAMASASSFSS